MNKKLIFCASLSLFLMGCNDNEEIISENEENAVDDSEDIEEDATDSEENEVTDSEETFDNEPRDSSESIQLTNEDLEGTYLYITDEERVRVIFDDGVLRFTDKRGNVRYRIPEGNDRVVIAYENPEIYKTYKTETGFKLVEINRDGQITGFEIQLNKVD